MPEEVCSLRWAGRQAVAHLPEHIDSSNASLIRDQLLLAINRGAAVLVADLSATVSCDYSAADALARAYQRALAAGTELRLVVTADVVRRVLGFSGVDRIIPIYPTTEAALAAGAGEAAGDSGIPVRTAPSPVPAHRGPAAGASHTVADDDLLDAVVNGIFAVGLALQAAADLPREAARHRTAEALGHLDEIVRQVRDRVFARSDLRPRPGPAGQPRPGSAGQPGQNGHQRADLAANRKALLQERMASVQERVTQTAYALHFAAAETAALLEERADLLRPPRPIDYGTEIKRWRVLAEQARQIAERWERL